MKILSKYLLIVFLALFFTYGVFGEWSGTFYVDVLEGDDDCDYPAFIGTILCEIGGGDWEEKNWGGYQTYTFNFNAPQNGSVSGIVQVATTGDDPIDCYGYNSESWYSPPTPAEIRVTVIPEII